MRPSSFTHRQQLEISQLIKAGIDDMKKSISNELMLLTQILKRTKIDQHIASPSKESLKSQFCAPTPLPRRKDPLRDRKVPLRPNRKTKTLQRRSPDPAKKLDMTAPLPSQKAGLCTLKVSLAKPREKT